MSNDYIHENSDFVMHAEFICSWKPENIWKYKNEVRPKIEISFYIKIYAIFLIS